MPLFKKRSLPLRVSDIMTRDVATATENATLSSIAAIMYERGIGSVIIVDEENKPIGIVTERDIVYAVAKNLRRDAPAWSFMTENPVVIKESDLITDAMEKMRELNIRHLPVVNEEGKLVGMVSFRDIVDSASLLLSLLRPR
ncbi:MAG: CBS domain-containing protein [Sulfolobales archaeon]